MRSRREQKRGRDVGRGLGKITAIFMYHHDFNLGEYMFQKKGRELQFSVMVTTWKCDMARAEFKYIAIINILRNKMIE